MQLNIKSAQRSQYISLEWLLGMIVQYDSPIVTEIYVAFIMRHKKRTDMQAN